MLLHVYAIESPRNRSPKCGERAPAVGTGAEQAAEEEETPGACYEQLVSMYTCVHVYLIR